jgi:hypothetical protein
MSILVSVIYLQGVASDANAFMDALVNKLIWIILITLFVTGGITYTGITYIMTKLSSPHPAPDKYKAKKTETLSEEESKQAEILTPEEIEQKQIKKDARELYKKKVFKEQGRCEICGKKLAITAKLKGETRCSKHIDVLD